MALLNKLPDLFECHFRQVFWLEFYVIFKGNEIRSHDTINPFIRGLTY